MTPDTHGHLETLPLAELVRRASAPPLAVEAEEALTAKAASGDASARERLVAAHLRDVVDEAIANRGSGFSVDVLARRGLEGLMEAAEQHDPLCHPPFGTFARERIRQAIRTALFAH